MRLPGNSVATSGLATASSVPLASANTNVPQYSSWYASAGSCPGDAASVMPADSRCSRNAVITSLP